MRMTYNNQSVFVSNGGVQWQQGLPTLFMLHGAGLNRTVWVLLGRYFARRGYNVVIPDLPGHGASEGEGFTTIEQNSEWVNALLVYLAQSYPLTLDNVVYCGHSMGSLVMLEAAAQCLSANDATGSTGPQVKQLMLLGSAVPMQVGEPLLDAARNNDHAAIEMINMFGHGHGSRIGNNPISGINVFNTMEALLERAAPGILYADLNACNNYKAGEEAAQRLKGNVSATIIAGIADRMTPVKMVRKLSTLLGARLVVLEDCGHMMMSEQPETTLQAMRDGL